MRANRAAFGAVGLLLATASAANAQRVDRARVNSSRAFREAPQVDVWIDRYSFRYGERLRVYFESEPGAYVTVLRITTTGELRVLYPRRPTDQTTYSDGRFVNYEIPYGSEPAFYLDEPQGIGFVFAVASYEPFDYRSLASGGRWSRFQLTSNAYEDPFALVRRFVSRTLDRRADYSTDYIQYEVVDRGRFRNRGYTYASYTDGYYRCLNLYSIRAQNYCESFVDFGIWPYIPYVIGRAPQQPAPTTPTPVAPRSPKALPPKTFVPDPMVGGGINPQTPAVQSAKREDIQRAWWELQRIEASRRVQGPRPDGALRGEPGIPASSGDRRDFPRPRIDVRPDPIATESPYTGRAMPRSEPAPQPRYEPRYEPAPQPRYEPPVEAAPRPRFEPRNEPRQAPPPMRVDPSPREIPSAPLPAPPPPPPPRVDPRSEPAVPPPAPPVSEVSHR